MESKSPGGRQPTEGLQGLWVICESAKSSQAQASPFSCGRLPNLSSCRPFHSLLATQHLFSYTLEAKGSIRLRGHLQGWGRLGWDSLLAPAHLGLPHRHPLHTCTGLHVPASHTQTPASPGEQETHSLFHQLHGAGRPEFNMGKSCHCHHEPGLTCSRVTCCVCIWEKCLENQTSRRPQCHSPRDTMLKQLCSEVAWNM